MSMLALARDKRTTSWAERSVTAGVFLGFGLGVGAWAASIPYFKARLGLSDGQLSFALVSLMAGSIVSMPIMGPLAARIGSELFDELDGPVLRVGCPFAPIPFAPELERALLPGSADIVLAVREELRR